MYAAPRGPVHRPPTPGLSGYTDGSTCQLLPPNPTELPDAVVEGSDGLLLEIDGKIVPNYDATIHPFSEGDVVTGHVVRIDNDEVLVDDIGYKSEGVIPANELSIRKSVDPGDEVSLGEEVDALVLTKEDIQDGRLIPSKKRAQASRRPGAVSRPPPSPVSRRGVIEVVKGGTDYRPACAASRPRRWASPSAACRTSMSMGTQIEARSHRAQSIYR